MLNKLFKKSIASKLFLMNVLILLCIVGVQLLFQVLYFETYYLNQKEKLLQHDISEFKNTLSKNKNKKDIIQYIEEVKKLDNVSLSVRDGNLQEGISLALYMGDKQILMRDSSNDEKLRIVLGDQFPNINIKKNDYIKVIGSKDTYGYIFPQQIIINDKEIKPYYEKIPSDIASTNSQAVKMFPSNEKVTYVEGHVEKLISEDKSYVNSNDIDLFLDHKEKFNIITNEKYTSKVRNINNANDILVTSEKFNNGYVIAITPLSQVNDVMATMNKYYFIIFFLTFILVTIISLIYSKFISRPLIDMSKVAKSISECDFENKYNVNSEDEIGVLGSSLNLISENLEKSLGELKEANIKLKDDMNTQRIQEDKRKELIANISHELKTPITIIQGSITGIKSGIYSTEMYEDILEETKKMNDLVKEMLEMSKLESPNFKLNKNPFDLWSIFLKENDKLKTMIKEKSIKINFDMEDEAVVFGDEKRINQVITNFLTNAIKYTPDGERINVTINISEDKLKYIFSIENFGVILTTEEKEKIWDSFYRTEKSRNKKYGGTGLGLSIVKRILELHKSNFGVESNNNSVKFYFSIDRWMEY